MYVSKFEKKVPTDEIGVVVAAARGQATRHEGIAAGVYAVGCAAEFLPDDNAPQPGPGPNPMVSSCEGLSDEAIAAQLEGHLPKFGAADATGAGGAIAIGVIQMLLPLLQTLLQRWMQPKPAGA